MTTKKATRPVSPATPAPSVIPAPAPEPGPLEKALPKHIRASVRKLARTMDDIARRYK